MDISSYSEKELLSILTEANDLYYTTGESNLTDKEFDYIKGYYTNRFRKEFKTKINKSTTCSQKNNYPILATWLKKTTNHIELSKWINKMLDKVNECNNNHKCDLSKKFNLFKVSPKYDGISIIVEYDREGNVVNAITRGNESHGVPVTQFFKNNLKHYYLEYKGTLTDTKYQNTTHYLDKVQTSFAVKYEAIMSTSSLTALNSTGSKIYKNRRNTIAGIFSSLNPEDYYGYVTLKPLAAYSHDFDEEYSTELSDNFLKELLNYINYDDLPQEYYPLTDYYYCNDEKSIFSYISIIDAIRNEIEFYDTPCKGIENYVSREFAYDGVVIELLLDYKILSEMFDSSFNDEPDFIVGHKLDAPMQITTIVGIENSIGSSGAITPLVYVEPVVINGNTYNKASFNNYGRVIKENIGYGDKVILSLRGDIIPYIEVLERSHYPRYTLPDNAKFSLDKNNNIVNAYCNDESIFLVEKCTKVLNILGIKKIKEQTIRTLIDLGLLMEGNNYINIMLMWCKTETDINNLIEYLKEQDNFGDIKANYLVHTIVNRVNDYFDEQTILSLLLIDGVSMEISIKLLQNIEMCEDYIKKNNLSIKCKLELLLYYATYFYQDTIQYISNFDGFGVKRAEIILNGILQHQHNLTYMLENLKVIPHKSTKNRPNQLKIVVTGELGIPRNDFRTLIENYNCILSNNVSKTTNYVVTNNGKSNSTKMKDAKKLNVKVVSEDEFYQIIGYSKNSKNPASQEFCNLDLDGLLNEY